VCEDPLWPYIEEKFTQKPPDETYTNGLLHRSTSYGRLPHDLLNLKSCLASGYPFVFGMSVYDSMMNDAVAASGVVPMPSAKEKMNVPGIIYGSDEILKDMRRIDPDFEHFKELKDDAWFKLKMLSYAMKHY
jgi:hypothetical protein